MSDTVPSPVIPGQWKDLEGDDALKLRQRYLDSLRMSFLRQFDREDFKVWGPIRATPLACYPRHLLCEIGLKIRGQQMAGAFLFGAEGVVILDGSSEPIHDLNDRLPLQLKTADAALDYARLFGSAVHGDEGRFQLISAATELSPYSREDPSQFDELLSPPEALPEGDEWRVQTVVRYGRTLFRAKFRLQRNGLIEMLEDEMLLTELACGPDRFEFLSRGLPICAGDS